jgi:virginiamycin B lyase
MYFSEARGNKIGRLNLRTNVINEWTIPTPTADAVGLEISADGRYVWFLEQGGNKVAVLDIVNNTITEWADASAILLSHLKLSRSVAFFTDR